MPHIKDHQQLIFIAFFLLMLGTAYQHFFWQTPYLDFLWSEYLFEPVVHLFGTDWQTYVSGQWMILLTEIVSILLGVIFLSGASSIFVVKDVPVKSMIIQTSCLFFLLFVLVGWQVEAFYLPKMLDKGARIGTVLIVFFMTSSRQFKHSQIMQVIKWTLAITFTIHGLFALNVFPIPGNFIDMTILIAGVNEEEARLILQVVGVLDILVSFGLFIRKTERVTFLYMAAWGLLTSLARIAAHFSIEFILVQSHRWIFEFLIRTPHFLLPLAGIIMRKQSVNIVNGVKSIR